MKYLQYDSDVQQAARNLRIVRGTPTDVLPTKRLNAHAQLPTYGSDRAAGLDMRANLLMDGVVKVTLEAGARRLFRTGIAVAVPSGHYARLAPRSGLAFTSGIDVLAGVIDEDYRGDVGVILLNTGHEPFDIMHGDRIAQLIIEKYTPCLVAEAEELPEDSRGQAGFGSTGIS